MPAAIDLSEIRQIGRYRVRRFVAGGGNAWVFEVEDPGFFDARRALKLLRPDSAVGEEASRFSAEVRKLARIQHPNLVRVHDFGLDPGTGGHFYTMDFLEGGTLADVRVGSAAGEATLERVCDYFLGVLAGLGRLHAGPQPIVHRDVKPSNVFLTAEGTAVLGDLGIAKQIGEAGVTRSGFVPGTPLYMSPEQSMGEAVGPESDLFSVGLSLYRLTTGRTVYEHAEGVDSTNSQAVLRHLWQLQGAGREFAFEFPPEVPETLRALVRKACRMRPESRYRTAEEMSDALRRAVRELDRAGKERPTRRRSRTLALAGGAVVVLLAGTLAVRALGRVLDARRTERVRGDAVLLQRDAHALLDWAAASGEGDAVELARRSIQTADDGVGDGDRDRAEGASGVARREYDDARRSYQEACDALVRGGLESLVERGRSSALDIAARVDPEARSELPGPWEELQAARGHLEGALPDAGCERGLALRERGRLGAEVERVAARIEGELVARLPERVRKRIAAAEGEERRAREAPVAHPTYAASLEEGTRSLAAARALSRGSEPQALRGALERASSGAVSFRRAADASAAVRARDGARAQSDQAEQSGLSIGVLRRALLEADRALESGAFQPAREGFEAVARGIAETLREAQPVLAARSEAEEARARAAADGLAPAELAGGDALRDEASAKLHAGSFEAAARGLRDAAAAYRAARDLAAGDREHEERALAKLDELLRESEAAEQTARGARVKVPAFGGALESGQQLLAEARSEREKKRYWEAGELARRSGEAFAEAQRIAAEARPALEARRRTLRELEAARRDRVERRDLASGEALLAEAERALTEGSFASAVARFDSAGRALRAAKRNRAPAPEPRPPSVPPPPVSSAPSNAEQEVRQLLEDWNRAWDAGDCALLARTQQLSSAKLVQLCHEVKMSDSQKLHVLGLERTSPASFEVRVRYTRKQQGGPLAPARIRTTTALVTLYQGRWVIGQID